MMNFEFVAAEVSHTFEDGVHILALASAKSEDYMILQRGTEFDEQDRELGQDTYYLEVSADGVAGYGGVESATLNEGRLDITLADNAKWREDLAAIRINVQALKGLDGLKAAITSIFADTDTTVRFD
ncbi:Imm10 family immunity protein [Burkholderia gladioli]|uniref:Imm10 family immunity protein n=1 Tax=Burkholderia gladioli TaxID=28095 RepID=UPI003D23F7AE